MSYHLRPLSLPDDLERMVELLAASWRDVSTSAHLQALEPDEEPVDACRLGAVDTLGRMVGYGQVIRMEGSPTGRYDLTIAVEPSGRGQGAGTVILEELEQYARDSGATDLCTEVRDNDAATLTFMLHWGYEVEGRRTGLIHLVKPL